MPGYQPEFSFPESPFGETIRLNKANSRESSESTRIATLSQPRLMPSANRLPVRRFDSHGPNRNESCESTRIATKSHSQLLPTASKLPVRLFDFSKHDSLQIRQIDSKVEKFQLSRLRSQIFKNAKRIDSSW